MNNSNHISIKNHGDAESKAAVRSVRDAKTEKNAAPDSRCVMLYNELDQVRKRHNLCRHLLGRAHLL